MAAGLRRVLAPGGSPGRRWIAEGLFVVVGLLAARLLYWIFHHPSPDLTVLMARWDFLVFAILAGCILGRLPFRARTWAVIALNLLLVGQYEGEKETLVVTFGCLVGFAALHWPATGAAGRTVIIQAVVVGGIIAIFWFLREVNPFVPPSARPPSHH